jgi:catechol 2,3-dioxygenase-like lactoylglutathione lyase family enzyme
MLNNSSFTATIPAKDIERSLPFYRDTLGFEVNDTYPDGSIMIEAGNGTQFMLYVTEFSGTAKHTLAMFPVDDLRAEMKELKGKGVSFEDYDMPNLKTEDGVADFDGSLGAWFTDPDGNILALFQSAAVPA